MWRGYVAFSALALVGLGVTGCGLSRFEQREPWRTQAEQACLSQGLVQPSAYMSRASAISGPGTCGMDYPFKVTALASGSVALSQKATLACPVISRIDLWMTEVVQPAANLVFGVPVVQVKSGSYSCRLRNNRNGAKLSEHSFGNAMDVMAFSLADGREVSVVRGWNGAPDEQEFLREAFVGACRYFSTVLGPGSDMFHYDHFHIDLARHDPRGERRVCKPVIKFTPRAEPREAVASLQRREAWRQTPVPTAAQQPALEDQDREEDPFAAAPAGPSRSPQVSRAPKSAVERFPVAAAAPPPVRSAPSYAPPAGPAIAAAPRLPPPRPSPMVLQPQLSAGQGIY